MRRLLKIVGVLGLVIALAGAGLAVAMIETTPSIARTAAPTPENVRDARRFVRGLRQAVETGQTQGEPFPVSEAELNSVLALGARFVPGFRGRAWLGRRHDPVRWGHLRIAKAPVLFDHEAKPRIIPRGQVEPAQGKGHALTIRQIIGFLFKPERRDDLFRQQ